MTSPKDTIPADKAASDADPSRLAWLGRAADWLLLPAAVGAVSNMAFCLVALLLVSRYALFGQTAIDAAIGIFVMVSVSLSAIPSYYTTENMPLNARHWEMVSAKRAMSGDSLISGIVGMSS
jgi:hypothetical protein